MLTPLPLCEGRPRLPEFGLRPFALGDVARDGDAEPAVSLAELTTPDFDGKHGAVLPAPSGLERQDFSGFDAGDDTLQARRIEPGVELSGFHSDQLLAGITKLSHAWRLTSMTVASSVWTMNASAAKSANMR
jgi:hypothetical protein